MFDTEIYNAKIVKTSLYKYVTDYKANVHFGQYFRSCKNLQVLVENPPNNLRRKTYGEIRCPVFHLLTPKFSNNDT